MSEKLNTSQTNILILLLSMWQAIFTPCLYALALMVFTFLMRGMYYGKLDYGIFHDYMFFVFIGMFINGTFLIYRLVAVACLLDSNKNKE